MKDAAMCHRSTEGGTQGDYGCDIVRPLVGHRAGDDAAQAVAYEMNLALGFQQRPCDVLIETMLDKQVRTFRIQANARKIRTVPNARQPGMQLLEIRVSTQESGDQDNSGA